MTKNAQHIGGLFTCLLALAGTASSQGSGVQTAATEIAKFSKIPGFVPVGPRFDAKKCMGGKSIFSVPVSLSIPFAKSITDSMKAVAKVVGFPLTVWENQGSPTQHIQGIERAVNQKVSLIDLLGGTDPRVLGPQIDAARAAGVKVVTSHYSGLYQKLPANLSGNVPIDYDLGGKLLADWVIAKTQGKGNALVVVYRDGFSTAPLENRIVNEFKKNCPGCKYKVVDVAIPDWATKIQNVVQSEINANPGLNYVLPIYDSMSQFVVPAITLTGAQDRVKVATFNGTPFVIDLIQKGQVEMDIGENLDWVAYGILDSEMRIACGLKAVANPRIPFYIFDKSNASAAGTPAQSSVGYGQAYVNGYRSLWGLK